MNMLEKTFVALYGLYHELEGPPTIRQITERMGLSPESHTSSVYYALQRLKEKELIGITLARGIYKPTTDLTTALEELDNGGETLEEARKGDSSILPDESHSQEGG